MKSKIKILSEVSGHYPDILAGVIKDEIAITPTEAISAMDLYLQAVAAEIKKLSKVKITIQDVLAAWDYAEERGINQQGGEIKYFSKNQYFKEKFGIDFSPLNPSPHLKNKTNE